MDETITIGSLTYAQKAKRALLGKGIRARLIKTEEEDRGCIYALIVPSARHLDAIATIRALGIPYRDRGI